MLIIENGATRTDSTITLLLPYAGSRQYNKRHSHYLNLKMPTHWEWIDATFLNTTNNAVDKRCSWTKCYTLVMTLFIVFVMNGMS
jgi:hypothetical protein